MDRYALGVENMAYAPCGSSSCQYATQSVPAGLDGVNRYHLRMSVPTTVPTKTFKGTCQVSSTVKMIPDSLVGPTHVMCPKVQAGSVGLASVSAHHILLSWTRFCQAAQGRFCSAPDFVSTLHAAAPSAAFLNGTAIGRPILVVRL